MVIRTLLRSIALLSIAPLSITAPAWAQETDDQGVQFVDFRFEAPARCMSEDGAFSLVHRRSRRVMRAPEGSASQRLNMVIAQDGAGYRGLLTVQRPGQDEEKRSMTGATCDEVVEALALTAALSIDPHATLTLGPAEDAELDQNNDVDRAPQDQDDDSEGDAPLPPTEFTLGASLAVEKIMDHAVHLGGGLVFSVSRPDTRRFLPLEARLSVYGLKELAKAPEEGVQTHLILARLAYCPVRLGGDFSLLICPASELGVLMARSRGFDTPTGAARFVATLGGEAWLRARVAESGQLWLSPALMAPVTQRQFAVEPGPEILASTVGLAWSVSSGIGWSF